MVGGIRGGLGNGRCGLSVAPAAVTAAGRGAVDVELEGFVC